MRLYQLIRLGIFGQHCGYFNSLAAAEARRTKLACNLDKSDYVIHVVIISKDDLSGVEIEN